MQVVAEQEGGVRETVYSEKRSGRGWSQGTPTFNSQAEKEGVWSSFCRNQGLKNFQKEGYGQIDATERSSKRREKTVH